MDVKEARKLPSSKNGPFTVVKTHLVFYVNQIYERDIICQWKVPFLMKMLYKRVGVRHRVEPPRKKRVNSLSTPNPLEKVKDKCDPDIYTKM